MQPDGTYPHKGRNLMEIGGVGFGGAEDCEGGGGGGGSCGSILYDCETSNCQGIASSKGLVQGAATLINNRTASSSVSASASSGDSAASSVTKTLLHFNTTSSSSSEATRTLFLGSSSEGMANERAAANFTVAQREELERQTMIFKYMMASVPVPPQLLLPLTKNNNPTYHRNSLSSCSSSSTDSEPWRCRRTDGKKWRCSRDVAPHQKYCERHSHKNRPRSRKPVESNRLLQQQQINSRNSSSVTVSSSTVNCSQDTSHHYLTVKALRGDFSHASAPPSPRCLEWFTTGEVIALPDSDQDWHNQQSKDLYYLKHYHHVPLSLYPDREMQARDGGGDALNDQCSLLLGIPSLEGTSNNGSSSSNNCVNDNDKAPCPLLSLAVFSDHIAGQDRGDEVQNNEDGDGKRGDLKPHWMSSGGPLAEALCLGSAGLGKSSPRDGRDH